MILQSYRRTEGESLFPPFIARQSPGPSSHFSPQAGRRDGDAAPRRQSHRVIFRETPDASSPRLRGEVR